MGQKVHPIGFRLGITQPHLSNWFVSKKNYSKFLLKDNLLRQKLHQKYKNANIEKIEIFRKVENHLNVIIHAEKPSTIVGEKGIYLIPFHKEVKQIVGMNIKLDLAILGLSLNKPISASEIANFLINLLEIRTPYKVALNKLFKEKKLNFVKGLKIKISGRLNGAEIARKYWIHNGRLPLQTLQENVDYCIKKAQTIYGVLGIKVWVLV